MRSLCLVLSIKTRARVVDLVASLAALVGPREVCDGNDEEAVRTIRNTGQRIIPRRKSRQQSKRTTRHNTSFLRMFAVVLEVANAQQQERHGEREEQEEEGNSRPECAEKQDECENKPAHEEQAEGVEECGFGFGSELSFDVDGAGDEHDGE